ncbi:ethanolamine utilization protein EutH [Leisingera sp.]|uniref:ethanolamine utilization protein EutH n=1 Tax=Leisingera sp. TaxID=1879318 RepID=UPI002B2666A5|nr:ethanolamine utilization protein EutH [Leisingera sp.]
MEIAGYTGIMLCGAFPMVWMLNRFLQKPMQKAGSWFGLSSAGTLCKLQAVSRRPPPVSFFSKPKDRAFRLNFRRKHAI